MNRFGRLALVLFAVGAVGLISTRQASPQLRMTLDDRLAAIENRLAELEDRIARVEERREGTGPEDRLTLESEAKLDRLEVRLIQLETAPGNCDCDGSSQQAVIARIRSLERQVGRLRSGPVR